MQIFDTDILVVGAGGAGLRAALSAFESSPDLKITVISRGTPGSHGVTATACSDRMAFHVSFPQSGSNLSESWRSHAMDIYAGGGYVSDPNLAELLAKESANAFYRLAELGVPFAMGPGNHPSQFITDGAKAPRACYTGPYTARDIEKALFNAVKNARIELHGNTALAEIILDTTGQISGASCISEQTDEWVLYRTRAIIIATGGPGSIFEHSVFPHLMDASPWHAVLKVGARLVNIEFIQFGLSSHETSLACSGSLMRALPRLCTQSGRDLLEDVERISPEHDPVELLFNKGASWPVSAESPSLAVDIAVQQAIRHGEDVLLDYSRNPDFVDAAHLNRSYPEIVSKWYLDRGVLLRANGKSLTPFDRLMKINPQVIEWFSDRGIDLQSQPVSVRHAAQHFQGGILINTKAETGVPGLYACGETAGGQHGANRPGGNALMDCQVMGHIAGLEASKRISSLENSIGLPDFQSEILKLEKYLKSKTGLDPIEAITQSKKVLSQYLGVVRTPDGMKKAEEWFCHAHTSGVDTGRSSLLDSIIAKSAVVIGLALTHAASMRTESRGSHVYFRNEDDYQPVPLKDPEGRIWNSVLYENGDIEIKKIGIPKLHK